MLADDALAVAAFWDQALVLVEAETLLSAKPPRLTQDEASFIRLCRTKETEDKDRELKNAQDREQLAIGRAEDARKAANKQRRLTRWAVGAAAVAVVGLVITAILAFYAWDQQNKTILALVEKGRAIDTLQAINRGQKSVFDAIDSKLGDNVLFQELAIDVYAKVTDTFQKELGLRPDDDELRHETAEMLIAYAWHLNDVGKPAKAVAEYQRAEGLLQTLEKSNPNDIEVALRRTFVMNNIAWAMMTAGDQENGRKQSEQTLARRRELLKSHPTNVECRRQVAVSLGNLANIYSDNDVPKALQYYQEAISIEESLWNEDRRNRWMGLNLSGSLSNLSLLHFAEDKLDVAIDLKTRAFDIAKQLDKSDSGW